MSETELLPENDGAQLDEDDRLKPEFVRRTLEATERLVDATADGGPALLFGTLHAENGAVFNAMILAEGGRIH